MYLFHTCDQLVDIHEKCAYWHTDAIKRNYMNWKTDIDQNLRCHMLWQGHWCLQTVYAYVAVDEMPPELAYAK